MMCRHVWKITGRVTQQSPIELFPAAGGTSFKQADQQNMFRQPLIVTSECSKCGTQKVERV